MAAAVGSLMILSTFNPEIVPASLVDDLYESLKYAGTVMTAFLISFPKKDSAIFFILVNTIAEISSGWNFLNSYPFFTTIIGLLFSPFSTLKGQSFISFYTVGSSNFLPISLLASKTVF